jgi:hypothetical protein
MYTMAAKKAPSNAQTARPHAVQEKLDSLYLRLLLVENLIESLETYARLGQEFDRESDRAA